MATNNPEEQQPQCDVNRFGGTVVVDDPRQGTAVAFEIFTHAIQPLNLRWSNQLLRSRAADSARTVST